MELESWRNGTESMTMLTTMICLSRKRAISIFVLSSEDQTSIHILAGVEQGELLTKKVRQFGDVESFGLSHPSIQCSRMRSQFPNLINFSDPDMENRIPLVQSLSIYVPRDERFSQLKMSDVYVYGIKAILHFVKPELEGLIDRTPDEFDSFQDVLKLYEGGIKLPKGHFVESIMETIPYEFVKELLRSDSDSFLKLPVPQVIKGTFELKLLLSSVCLCIRQSLSFSSNH